jgi:hypothetical protein
MKVMEVMKVMEARGFGPAILTGLLCLHHLHHLYHLHHFEPSHTTTSTAVGL